MSEFIMPSTQEDQIKLLNAAKEICDSRIRQAAEADFQKDVCSRIKEELDIAPTDLKGIAGEMFDDKASKNVTKFESYVEAADVLRELERNRKNANNSIS